MRAGKTPVNSRTNAGFGVLPRVFVPVPGEIAAVIVVAPARAEIDCRSQ